MSELLDPAAKLNLAYWMRLTRTLDDAVMAMWKQGRGVGGTFSGKGHEAIAVGAGYAMGPDDVVIAISFRPYADDTAAVAERAKANGAPLIAISDSRLSPIARDAAVCFEIKDAEVRQFRSLTASMCIAQTLVISYAYRYGLEKIETGAPKK